MKFEFRLVKVTCSTPTCTQRARAIGTAKQPVNRARSKTALGSKAGWGARRMYCALVHVCWELGVADGQTLNMHSTDKLPPTDRGQLPTQKIYGPFEPERSTEW